MKSKQHRQQQEAAKQAIRDYIEHMEKRCYVHDPLGACPDCVRAYEHTITYYRQTFKENP